MTDANTVKKAIECPECRGFGTIGDGPFSMGQECPMCGGYGAKNISVATEQAVRAVLKKTADQSGRKYDEHLVSMLLVTIDGPDAQTKFGDITEEMSSLAVLKVRAHLWGSFPPDVASLATCNLYYLLGRQEELGWFEECVPGYEFHTEDFS